MILQMEVSYFIYKMDERKRIYSANVVKSLDKKLKIDIIITIKREVNLYEFDIII